jgi:competence protein ComEA
MSDWLVRFRWPIVAILAAPILLSAGYLVAERLDEPDPLVIERGEATGTDIRVYVAGAVQNPGVYPVSDGARWIDAIEAAGGPASDANIAAVNLARRALDEDHIVVPRMGQVAVSGASQAPVIVNINTADQAELESLPGIGEVRASRIIQSRTVDGPFAQIEDLLLREIVPDSVFEDIAPMITVD